MRSVRVLVIVASAVALALLVLSGPGTRMGLWSWQVGLQMLRWAAYIGLGAGAVALVLLALHFMPRWRPLGFAVPLLALAFSVAAFAPPIYMLGLVKQVPPIHDITTDVEQPPQFVALLPERRAAPNGVDYGGPQIAAQQKKAYPDIVPKVLAAPPREAMQRIIDAARAMGWQVAASDVADGRLEATATTAWFGFKDDVVVRVRPDGTGSRVDVRSVSRVGRSDVGTNARRIREFLARLA
ncbi:MAG TPA: DUF1499 domain-containing protein [Usitatibacter sp.]|nr:DUF1499 domain-containing protein [Usitatibacter sp.]